MAYFDDSTNDDVFTDHLTLDGISNCIGVANGGNASPFDSFQMMNRPTVDSRRNILVSASGYPWSASNAESTTFPSDKRFSISSCTSRDFTKSDANVQMWPTFRNELVPNDPWLPQSSLLSSTFTSNQINSPIETVDENDPNYIEILTKQFSGYKLKPQPLVNARKSKRKRCGFCFKNGEAESIYTSHSLKDPCGNVTCPVLRLYVCPICNEKDKNRAHTVSYCPSGKRDNSHHLAPGYGLSRDTTKTPRTGQPNLIQSRSMKK